jgi:RimJ/RimL family protein N-acetyltransferase
MKARTDEGGATQTRLRMAESFETARLSLSLVRETDGENLVALEQDPQVMRFLNGGRPTPNDGVDRCAGFLTPRGCEVMCGRPSREVQARSLDGSGSRFAARARERRRWASRSVATRGVEATRPRALVAKGFADSRLKRMVATTIAVNLASRLLLEKAGLARARTVHARWAEPLPGSETGDFDYKITCDAQEATTIAPRSVPR